MSATFNSTVAKAGLLLSLVAASSPLAAKTMNLQEFMGHSVTAQMQQVQNSLHNEVVQDVYQNAFASLKSDAALPSFRPAVIISDVSKAADEEDEE